MSKRSSLILAALAFAAGLLGGELFRVVHATTAKPTETQPTAVEFESQSNTLRVHAAQIKDLQEQYGKINEHIRKNAEDHR